MASIEQRLNRGSRAREVLENEVFIEAFSAIEQEYIEAWKTSPARDEEGRQRIWLYLKALEKVKTQLTQTMETGQLAIKEMEHRQSMLDKAKTGIVSWLG